MNRREFLSTIAALAAFPAIPFVAKPAPEWKTVLLVPPLRPPWMVKKRFFGEKDVAVEAFGLSRPIITVINDREIVVSFEKCEESICELTLSPTV